jgi:hypothetical protein
MAFYVILMPVFTYYFLKFNHSKLKNEDFNGRFGSLYLNLKTNDITAIYQSVLFFTRRLIYAFSIVFFGEVPYL